MNNKFNFNKTFFQSSTIYIYYLIISTFLFYFIFAPSINILYYAGDDYRYSFGGLAKQCSADDGFYFMLTLGRPIQAYLDCLSFKFGYTLEHMKIIRFLTFILLSCSVSIYAYVLRQIGLFFWTSFFLAGSVFTFQLVHTPIMLMGSLPLPLAVLFALIGYLCVNYSYACETTKKKVAYMILSGSFVLLGFLAYPAMAFIFPTLILAKLLFSERSGWLKSRREILYETSVFCAVCLIYYMYANLNMHFNEQAPVPASYRLDHPNITIMEIVKRLLAICSVFYSPWKVLSSNTQIFQSFFHVVFLLGSFLIAVIYAIKNNLKDSLQRAFLLIGIFILCNAFLLLMPNFEFVNYEPWLQFSSFAAILLIFFWSLLQWFNVLPGLSKQLLATFLIAIFFFICSYQENMLVLARASTFENILNENRKAMEGYLKQGKALKRLHFVLPKTAYPYDNFFQSNGALTVLSHGIYQLTWCSLPRGVPGEEKDHQKEALECINHLSPNEIAVTYSYLNDPYKKTSNMLIISKS